MISPPTKEEIEAEFVGTNFGRTDYELLVKQGLLKVACHFHNGFTLQNILIRLGLIKPRTHLDGFILTNKGRDVMYQWFSVDPTI